MKHRSSQIIFRHWDALREQRTLPERADIDPMQIRSALADCFILSYDTDFGHRFRLAGTRLCALLGQELKDKPITPFWRPAERPTLDRLINTAADDSIGIVAAISGQPAGEPELDLELLLLPLKHSGKTHLRLIGSLAPLSAPAWQGTHPISGLRVGDYRYLNHSSSAPPTAPALPQDVVPDRVRYGLAIYDGGRS